MTGGGNFPLLLEVRLKYLFLCLPCMVAFAVTFPAVVIDSYHQSIHILEQNRFFLFLSRNRILDLIWEFLVIAVA